MGCEGAGLSGWVDYAVVGTISFMTGDNLIILPR